MQLYSTADVVILPGEFPLSSTPLCLQYPKAMSPISQSVIGFPLRPLRALVGEPLDSSPMSAMLHALPGW